MKKYLILIINILEKYFLKINLGTNSVIKLPFVIWNKKYLKLGKNVFISEGSFFAISKEETIPKVSIGDNTTIGKNFFLACIKNISIGNDVLISNNVFITDHNHGFKNINQPIIKQELVFSGSVFIGNGSFIGINCVILPGVKIGKNVFIGASSVITKDIPDYSVVVGNPGKIIKYYDKKKKKWIDSSNEN